MNTVNQMKPTISVNKLGEYITASAARRKSIVQSQKYPSDFIVSRYTEVREAYTNLIVSNHDKSVMDDAKEIISAMPTNSDFQINNKATSLEALSCFENINFPDLSKFEISRFNGNGKIDISGVDVRVNPNIIFRGIYRNKAIIGAIKLHIVKSTLNEEARKAVATTVHQFIEDIIKSDDEIAPVDYTFSVDVFSHKCEKAPKSYKRRRSEIQAACEEYALWWERL